MRTLALVIATVLSSTSADAAPQPMTFRQLDWSQASATPNKLTTYSLLLDGKTATVDVVFSKFVQDKWEVDSQTSLKGTASTDKGSTLLTLDAPNGDHPTYRCTTRKLPVAAATARRRIKSSGEAASVGAWAPKKTTLVSALFCTRTDIGSNFYLDAELTFAKRSIEHVRADSGCCTKPGDSLRFVPSDQLVTPTLDCASNPAQASCRRPN